MSRFVAMHCGPEVDALQERHPNAFLLLCQIARRAKWQDCPVSGMLKGEAFIGDYKAAGIKTEKRYVCAKKKLVRMGCCGFKGASKGTVATLFSNSLFSTDTPDRGEQGTNKGRTKGEQRASKGRLTTPTPTQTPGHTEERELFPPPKTKPAPSGSQAGTEPTAEEIYSEYPRKVGPDKAIPAIRKALKTRGGAFLMDRTQAYAKAVRWQEKQFIPHPATWFNRGSFDDDPQEWEAPPASVPSVPCSPPDGEAAEIVALYPRRERFAEAVAEVQRQIAAGEDPAAIADGTRAAAAILVTLPGGALNDYVPGAFSFFKDKRWQDNPRAMFRNGSNPKTGAPPEKLDLGGRRPARVVNISDDGEIHETDGNGNHIPHTP